MQYINDDKCFQESYQRISYLNIEDEIIPKEYKLYKNFPNPFNPTTNISFDLPEANHISLDIYNIKGQHIQNITNEYFAPGHYQFKFNGSNLSSGIYFIVLSSNAFILSNKMVLLK